MSEEWRAIPGFPGYEVSDYARVRSWKRQAGGVRAEPRSKAQTPDKDGYATVSLMRGGKQTTERVSHLVLAAFKGPRPDGLEARHLNGNESDDRPANLEWSTHLVNIRDKHAHGTMPRGDSHWSRRMPERRHRGERVNSKLTDEKVRTMRAERKTGATLVALGVKYGVDHTLVGRICRGKAWAHVR